MKKVLTKMMRIKYGATTPKLILTTLLSVIMLSCSNDDDKPPTPTFNDIPQNIKDLIYFSGDEKASTVLINAQAGPSIVLDEELVDNLSGFLSPRGILTVNVHQAQTLNPEILLNNDITLDDAVNFNNQSIETLYEVVNHFKDEGRTVYVLGLSFGAFITQELIAQKGIDVADKYLIITGRLDMNDVFWQALAEGRTGDFENGVTPILNSEPEETIFGRNEAKLFAGLIMNRYTQHFSSIESLSNITYIYGETDEAVGSLTAEEISFLQSKNANILSGTGGHDEPFEGFIEQGFSEAFGIE
ncbi:hypothetical protein [uncultured Psychroserpens sp.]|uniref:hypothetical protein n=1 Tax=uncultured Psychroserpens sp. TaxID=255436 RepID=UPI00263323EE|nr:hypothetical protein [uncultured Psychroserpens sp.]